MTATAEKLAAHPPVKGLGVSGTRNDDLGVAVGDRVTALIKATSVMLVK